MSIHIPSAILNNNTPAKNFERQEIGNPGDSNATKSRGGIPSNLDATWMTVGNNTTEGWVWNFDGANGASSSATNYNVSSETKLLVCSWQYNAPNRIELDTAANGGMEVRMVTGTGNSNYRSHYICGSDTVSGFYQPGVSPFVIDLNVLGDASNGTYDNTDVQAWGWIVNSKDNGGASFQGFIQRLHIFDTELDGANIVKFTGTSEFDEIINTVLGTNNSNAIGGWVRKLGSTVFIPVAFQIGDNSTATNFDDKGLSVTTPSHNEATDPRYRYTTQGLRVYVKLRNNPLDSCTLSGSYVWNVASPWNLDVSNDSNINLEGANFSGMGNFTIGSSVNTGVGGAKWNLDVAGSLIIEGASINGSTVNGDVYLNTETDLTNVTINGNLFINTGANSTINFNNVQLSGSVQNDAASNTLVVSGSNGTTFGSIIDAGNGNGQTNFQTLVTVTVTVTDISGVPIENARVYLKTTNDGILYNDLTDFSGTISFSYSYLSDESFVESKVRKSSSSPYFKPSKILGTIISGGFSSTVIMLIDE